MPEIINMPRLSDTMEEGTVAKWFKKVGDIIKEGDILAEIETDKATMEFEAFYEGELLHIGVNEGETAPVDSLLAIIGEKNENISKYIDEPSKDSITKKSDVKSENIVVNENKPITNINKNLEVINMPRLSDTMEEGVVASWNKKVGDIVKEGDILAEIETDKATMEFESFYSGHLIYIGVKEGESALVDSVLAIIGDKDTDVDEVLLSLNSRKESSTINESSNTTKKEEYLKEKSKESEKPIKNIKSEIINNDRIFASPLAKKIAIEKGIKISQVSGTRGKT